MALARAKTVYRCNECGAQQPKWNGQCPDCQAWNTLEEERAAPSATKASTRREAWSGTLAPVRSLSDCRPEELPRTSTGIAEFDRVLGGGLVAGSVLLIGGDPGIGKSTGQIALRAEPCSSTVCVSIRISPTTPSALENSARPLPRRWALLVGKRCGASAAIAPFTASRPPSSLGRRI